VQIVETIAARKNMVNLVRMRHLEWLSRHQSETNNIGVNRLGQSRHSSDPPTKRRACGQFS